MGKPWTNEGQKPVHNRVSLLPLGGTILRRRRPQGDPMPVFHGSGRHDTYSFLKEFVDKIFDFKVDIYHFY